MCRVTCSCPGKGPWGSGTREGARKKQTPLTPNGSRHRPRAQQNGSGGKEIGVGRFLTAPQAQEGRWAGLGRAENAPHTCSVNYEPGPVPPAACVGQLGRPPGNKSADNNGAAELALQVPRTDRMREAASSVRRPRTQPQSRPTGICARTSSGPKRAYS